MIQLDIQGRLDRVSPKLSTDKKFAKKFFSDYRFAKEELGWVGSEIELRILHRELYQAYQYLSAASSQHGTYENNLEKNKRQPNIAKASNGFKFIGMGIGVSILIAAMAIYLRRRRL